MNVKKIIAMMVSLVIVMMLATTTVFAAAAEQRMDNPEQKSGWRWPWSQRSERSEGSENRVIIKGDAKLLCELLGIDKETLVAKLEAGGNLHDMLKEAGKLEEFKKAMLEAAQVKFDKLVEENKLTREEADKKLNEYRELLDKWDGKEPLCHEKGKMKMKRR